MAEVLSGNDRPGADLVQVAFAGDPAEAGMIQGLLEGAGIPSFPQATGLDGRTFGQGLLPPGPQRVMVHAARAEQARALLTETLVAAERDEEPEIANARHLDEAAGKKPRSYGLIGAYARIYIWSLGLMGLAFAVFLLVRSA